MPPEEQKPTPVFPCLNCDQSIDALIQGEPPLFCSNECRHEAEFVRFARRMIGRREVSKLQILKASKQWFALIAGKKEIPDGDIDTFLIDLFGRIESDRPLKVCDDEKKWYKTTMQKILSERIKQYPVSKETIALAKGTPLRLKGAVKWFLDEEGHGVIKRENGDEIPVHYTDINKKGFKTLLKGERVTFDMEKGIKGPRAVNDTVIS